MSDAPVPPPPSRWRRRCGYLVVAWILSTVLLSFSTVRGWVAYPLCEHDEQAKGDVAYVMAGGPPYLERLRAASDLYHWKRVPRIVLLDEPVPSGYNFTLKRQESRVERAIDYLALHGVPRDRVSLIKADPSTRFGSLSEARAFAKRETDISRVVVVTSAPHTRRCGLSFRRSLPSDVRVDVYSASELKHSAEIHSPLWIEYVKLVVYFCVA